MLGSKKKELTYTYHKTGIKLAFVWQGVFRANVKFCIFRSDKLKFALSLLQLGKLFYNSFRQFFVAKIHGSI